MIFSNVQQVYADSEEEVEDVSENEDWEELQPRALMHHLQRKTISLTLKERLSCQKTAKSNGPQ
jgi:hypothetical protein